MESLKAVEVELEEITTGEENKDEKRQETEADPQSNTVKEAAAEANVYSTLNEPSEHVYGVPSNIRSYTVNKDASPDVQRRLRVYRIISLALLIICVLLLILILVLFVKLTGKESCPIGEENSPPLVQTCSFNKCQELGLSEQTLKCRCSDCGKDWLRFENSCYFLSQNRLSWHKSREECRRMGGDLAVITNERVQKYLSDKGKLHYWIGLNDVGTNEWKWINNGVLTVRYWGENPLNGDCALLHADEPADRSWHSSSCTTFTQYICQK